MSRPPQLQVAVTGASGLIGSALVARLSGDGYRVTRLVRRPAGSGEISWDPSRGKLNPADLEGVDILVHLAGENVGARWTTGRKARIRNSRVAGTRLLSQALAALGQAPRVMVSASAIGIYGDRGDEILTEASPTGELRDFLVSVALAWEEAAEPARAVGVRVVHPRFGIVLSPGGGALKKMLLPFRLGLGGRLGTGAQWMSWIAIDDAVNAIHHAIMNDHVHGPVNFTAPAPVTNRDFTRILGRVLSRPTLIGVPPSALRLALGEMAGSTVLSSARVMPARLLETGYRFVYPELESALRHVLKRDRRDNFPQ